MELLNDMALFVEIVKAKSFRGAARVLDMPNSTLSRRISGLEKALGLRLLHRTTRKLELTEAGQIYFNCCTRIVDDARLAHEQLREMVAQPSGLLRASMPVDFAQIFLAPLIAQFAQRYPRIRFDIDLSPRNADLISDPIDIAIRMGQPPDPNLIARLLFKIPRYLYASPRYLELAGEPETPSDLVHHECLRLRTGEADTWRLCASEETADVHVGGRFLLNNVGMIQRLAILDMGIAVLAGDVVTKDVEDGKLRRVLPDWEAPPVPVYAITETRLLPAKTQLFIDFLKEQLGQIYSKS